MMSVLINGMEMPADGCHHIICIYADGTVATGRREYRAIPLLDGHGRLIDADALKDKWTHKDLDLFSQGWGWLRDLNQAPTIIPAEEV